jgi:hypothetical protein
MWLAIACCVAGLRLDDREMPEQLLDEESVATRLRTLRGRRPQTVIAAGVGVSLRAYQQWEAGGGIAWHNLDALAKLHSVSTEWLLSGAEPPERAGDEPGSAQASLASLLEAMAAEREHRDRATAALLELVNSAREEWRELRLAVQRIDERRPLDERAVQLRTPAVGQPTSERLDSIEAKLQALLGIALERELELAVEQDGVRSLDSSATPDEASR